MICPDCKTEHPQNWQCDIEELKNQIKSLREELEKRDDALISDLINNRL